MVTVPYNRHCRHVTLTNDFRNYQDFLLSTTMVMFITELTINQVTMLSYIAIYLCTSMMKFVTGPMNMCTKNLPTFKLQLTVSLKLLEPSQ